MVFSPPVAPNNRAMLGATAIPHRSSSHGTFQEVASSVPAGLDRLLAREPLEPVALNWIAASLAFRQLYVLLTSISYNNSASGFLECFFVDLSSSRPRWPAAGPFQGVSFQEDSGNHWLLALDSPLEPVDRRFQFLNLQAAAKLDVNGKQHLVGAKLHGQQIAYRFHRRLLLDYPSGFF